MRKYLFLIPFILFAGDLYNITGKVIDFHTGRPIDKANVVMMDTPFNTETDKEGKYAIRYVPAGTYWIFATAEGYDTLIYLNTVVCYNIWEHSPTTSLSFQIKPIADSSANRLIDSIVIYEYGSLIGKITNEVTGECIPRVLTTIERTRDKRPNCRILVYRNTNNDGIYKFERVPVGTYKFEAEMIGYRPYVGEEIIIEPNDTTIFNFSMSWYDTTGKEIERLMLEKSEVLEGEDLIIAGKYDKALKFYEKIITSNPKDWVSWFYLALCHLKLEEYKKAIDIYENKVLEIDPKSIDAMYHLAYCYRELGNVRKALEWVIKAEETEKKIQKLRGK